MTDRVLLGEKGSDYGLWVSRPNKEVTSVGREDLIFSSEDLRTGMLLRMMDLTLSNSAYNDVYFNGDQSSIGYIPFVIASEIDGDEIKGIPWEFSFIFPLYNIGSEWYLYTTNSKVRIGDAKGVASSGTFRILVFAIPADTS